MIEEELRNRFLPTHPATTVDSEDWLRHRLSMDDWDNGPKSQWRFNR